MNRKILSVIISVLVVGLSYWISLSNEHKTPSSALQPTVIPTSNQDSSAESSSSAVLNGSILNSSKCNIRNGLPDPICTPGVIAETDTYTVCHRSTKTVRPSVSYTEKLKVEQIQQYGYLDTDLKDYEEDHLISLELGGSPTDPKNLWPEPRKNIAPLGETSEDKDKIENLCHQKVCSGQIGLSDAQQQIATNWKTACQ